MAAPPSKLPLCPRCGRNFVLPAGPESFLEQVLRLFFVYPFRCQLCMRRFSTLRIGMRHEPHRVDRRKYVRVPLRVPVSFGGDDIGEGTTTDLSMEGCGLTTDVRLTRGKVVWLSFKLPDVDRPIKVEAAVVRSVRPGVAGLELLRLAPPDRERLTKYMAGRLIQQLNRPKS